MDQATAFHIDNRRALGKDTSGAVGGFYHVVVGDIAGGSLIGVGSCVTGQSNQGSRKSGRIERGCRTINLDRHIRSVGVFPTQKDRHF